MTADYIAFHALERPDAVAFVNNGRTIAYREFGLATQKVARAVRALGVPRGGLVAVGCDDAYLHWLLLLACERLGMAAASLVRGEREGSAPLLAAADLVIAEEHYYVAGARRHHAITRPWVQAAQDLATGGDELPSKAPDDPVRIVRTSGTTGISKRFLVLRRMHDAVVAQWSWGFELTRHSRYLLTVPLTVRATYDFGSACLRAGGTVVFENRTGIAQALTTHAITHAILLPIDLRSLLDLLPPDYAKPRDLTILSFGAAVSRTLRERAIERMATALCDLYGTVEVPIISTAWRSDGFGTLWPDVCLEAVDEGGEPVPPGTMGRIKVRTPSMSERYLDDPETTRRMFRDGWFHPGDVGILQSRRQLRILGRADDLLNIGGLKFAPAALEEQISSRVTADDVAVCAVQNPDGIETLCIAFSNPGHDDKELHVRIATANSDLQPERIRIVTLDRIPRNANGKIERGLLKEAVARALRVP